MVRFLARRLAISFLTWLRGLRKALLDADSVTELTVPPRAGLGVRSEDPSRTWLHEVPFVDDVVIPV